MRVFPNVLMVAVVVLAGAPAFAQEAMSGTGGLGAIAAALAIGIAALGGALAQGRAATAALEGLARNPEAKVMGPMIIGLALIESLVIYALIIALQLVGKV